MSKEIAMCDVDRCPKCNRHVRAHISTPQEGNAGGVLWFCDHLVPSEVVFTQSGYKITGTPIDTSFFDENTEID